MSRRRIRKKAINQKNETNKGNSKPNQQHHIATNKSKVYTNQFDNLTQKYGLNLNDDWNKILLPHLGRHPNEYHDWVLEQMNTFDKIAKGNRDIFLKLFIEVRDTLIENPDMLDKIFWK